MSAFLISPRKRGPRRNAEISSPVIRRQRVRSRIRFWTGLLPHKGDNQMKKVAGLCWFFLCAFLTSNSSFSDEKSEHQPPTLEYFMTYHIEFERSHVVENNRSITNLPGGWIKMKNGDRGRIIPPSGDWHEDLGNGILRFNVRASILMDEGDVIYIEYIGRMQLSEDALTKLGRGEKATDSDFYLVSLPVMHTTSEKYHWVNQAAFVAKGVELQSRNNAGIQPYLRYEIYKVDM